ncbi:MAG: DUF87 domain-containing protein, partial [Candidatus Brocadiia bacterium]
MDIEAKAPLLERLARAGHYTCNQTGLSMRSVEVGGVDGLCLGEDEAPLQAVLAEADLVFTAVGQSNLPKLAPTFAAALVGRDPDRPLRVLCSENGVEIARGLRDAVKEAASEEPGDLLLVGDTVMGRMCKIVEGPQPPVERVAPGLDWAVVAEPFYGIPVEEHALAGFPAVPTAVRPLPPAEFSAAEDVKMMAHNGLHAVLACLGHLRGMTYFDELRDEADLMEIGRRLLVEEAAPALLRKHGPALPRNECLNYCDSILRRVTCPVLNDPIERGTRGIMRKLQPWERLVYSVRTIAKQGVLATSGAGKSYMVKLNLLRLFMAGTKVFVLDPHGEYRKLTEAVGGHVIEISKDSNSIINVMDLMGESLENKRLSLPTAFKIMFGGLTEPQLSVLDKAITTAYEDRGIMMGDSYSWSRKPPTIGDLYNTLKDMSKSCSKREYVTYNTLISRLEKYVTGVFSFMNKQTSLDLDNDFICFDIQKMPKHVQPLMMYLVMEFVYSRMKKDKSRKVCAIDEAWSLLKQT